MAAAASLSRTASANIPSRSTRVPGPCRRASCRRRALALGRNTGAPRRARSSRRGPHRGSEPGRPVADAEIAALEPDQREADAVVELPARIESAPATRYSLAPMVIRVAEPSGSSAPHGETAKRTKRRGRGSYSATPAHPKRRRTARAPGASLDRKVGAFETEGAPGCRLQPVREVQQIASPVNVVRVRGVRLRAEALVERRDDRRIFVERVGDRERQLPGIAVRRSRGRR